MGQGEGEEDGVKGSGGKDGGRENHADMRPQWQGGALVRHHPGGLEQEICEDVGEQEGGEGCGHSVFALSRRNALSASQIGTYPAPSSLALKA